MSGQVSSWGRLFLDRLASMPARPLRRVVRPLVVRQLATPEAMDAVRCSGRGLLVGYPDPVRSARLLTEAEHDGVEFDVVEVGSRRVVQATGVAGVVGGVAP